MELFALSFLVIAIAMLAMGVGVLFGRSPIRGSCGGLGGTGGHGSCILCAGQREGADCPHRAAAGAPPRQNI